MNEIHVVGAAILRDSRCLVARRGPTMSLPGKWEFPGGKVEDGEDPRAALIREIEEELGIAIEVEERLGQGRAPISRSDRNSTTPTLVLDVYAARWLRGELRLHEHSEVAWISVKELRELDWAPADVPILEAVRARLRAAPGALEKRKARL